MAPDGNRAATCGNRAATDGRSGESIGSVTPTVRVASQSFTILQ